MQEISAKNFFTELEQKQIVLAIEEAEKNTSGEIRIHVENESKKDPLERATELFVSLEMHNTIAKNGILFYIAVKSHRFSVVGDVGINNAVSDDFWKNIANELSGKFKEGNFLKGILDAIQKCGNSLKEYFPYLDNDTNELSDEISFGD